MIRYRNVGIAAGMLAIGCTDTLQQPSDARSTSAVLLETPVVLVGAGDIAGCPSTYKDEATAKLLDGIPGTVFTLGDNVYPDGTAAEFTNCYGPSWGRHRARTRPAPGNHEYHVTGATGYFGFFGTRARPGGRAYYSYNVGSWHIVVLDSERLFAEQAAWLKADLAANPRRCTLAYWHKPYFTTGDLPPARNMKNLVTILYKAKAEIIVTGHNHIYERFTPQTPEGVAKYPGGIRSFTVGTGGAPLLPMRARTPNLKTRQNTAHGVLKLSLYSTRYEWKFVSVPGKTYSDSGGTNCH